MVINHEEFFDQEGHPTKELLDKMDEMTQNPDKKYGLFVKSRKQVEEVNWPSNCEVISFSERDLKTTENLPELVVIDEITYPESCSKWDKFFAEAFSIKLPFFKSQFSESLMLEEEPQSLIDNDCNLVESSIESPEMHKDTDENEGNLNTDQFKRKDVVVRKKSNKASNKDLPEGLKVIIRPDGKRDLQITEDFDFGF